MWKLVYILLCVAAADARWSTFVPFFKSSKDSGLDWWEHGVFYQIYPRSFKDSDGDGIGDIRGIIEKLDHLSELGVTGAWLGPIFRSPMKDGGYDVSDFYAVDPIFGTDRDLEELLAKAKNYNIKIILEFVPNHTSDRHEWFYKSANREAGYEDFYIWRDCELYPENNLRRMPNNWVSVYNAPAWTYNAARDQCYLHHFLPDQPELNMRNPEVVKSLLEALKFWLNKGVDGFRMDAVNFLYETEGLPTEEYYNSTADRLDYNNLHHTHSKNRPESYEFINDLRAFMDIFTELSDDKATRLLMTEAYTTVSETSLYYGVGRATKGAHVPLNFELITAVNHASNAKDFKDVIDSYLDTVPVWGAQPNWVLGNHDNPRISNRFGYNRQQGLAILSMLLPGVSVIYYGEEIAMDNNLEISFEDSDDPNACLNEANYKLKSRDPQRTPFQWDDTANAGFSTTTGKTWLPVNNNYRQVNLLAQRRSTLSMFELYRVLIRMRRHINVLQIGGFRSKVLSENVFGFVRTLDGHNTLAVIINFMGGTKVNLTQLMEGELDESKMKASIMLAHTDSASTYDLPSSYEYISEFEEIELGMYEAMVFEVSSSTKLSFSIALVFCTIAKFLF